VILQLRRWRRHPLLAANHLATVSIGLAAVTAVASVTLAVAFRPLPFRDASRLVEVWNRVQSGAPVESLSGAELTELEDQTKGIFTSIGGYTPLRMWLLDEERGAKPVRVLRLESGALHALDLKPILGLSLVGSSGAEPGMGSVWISHDLWQTRFGGVASVIGQSVHIAQNEAGLYETRSEIAGVLPPGLRIPGPGIDIEDDLWAVLPDDFKIRAGKVRAFFALGRLGPERTLAEVQSALTLVADRRQRPSDRRYRPVVQGLEEIAHGPARRTIGLLAIGIGLVLLLAFANLTSLTVAEGSRRRAELCVRTALGASRWHIWRGLAAEQVALTMCGVGLGVPLGWLTLRLVTRLAAQASIGPTLPHPPALNVYAMLGFSTCALFANLVWATILVRNLQTGHPEGHSRAVQDLARGASSIADRRAAFLRLSVLTAQSCLGLALMVLAVSLARTYVQVTTVNLGPAPERTTFFQVSPGAGGTLSADQAADFTSRVRSLVRTLPNVQAVASADAFPPQGSMVSFWKHDDSAASPRQTTTPLSVSHDYFGMLGIRVLHGRVFGGNDRFGGEEVVVIDHEMARRNWAAAQDAVNARIRIGTRGPFEVIGVVESFTGYWAQVAVPTVYLSQDQHPGRANVVILRTATAEPSVGELVRQQLRSMPGGVDVSGSTTLQSAWYSTSTGPRARMVGMLLLALVGVALGAQGVYALAASIVAARGRELAVRSALGASRSVLVWLVLRQVLISVVIGLSIGGIAIFAASQLAPQWLSATLDETAVPIALGALVLLLTAVVGGVLPTRPATRQAAAASLLR
jgi:putative ABC transport system permease protein